MFLFIDTESTGLPINWKAPMQDLGNWPRIIQLAFQCYDINEKLIGEFVSLIKPDGWEIPSVKNLMDKGLTEVQAVKDSKFWVEQGYTTENNMAYGVPMYEALEKFLTYYKQSVLMVAHNMSFDYNVLGAEMLRYKVSSGGHKIARLCTKEASTNFCKLPNQNGYKSFKWPRLDELHQILFNKGFESAHDALADCSACARCFFDLKKRGVIKL